MPLTYAAAIRVLDADPPIPDGPPSSYAAWVSMLDAKMYARYGLAGHLAWSGTMGVSGTALLPVVQLGAITAACLYDAATTGWYAFASGEVDLDVSHVEGSPGTLSANTWYYVYAYATPGGSPTFAYQISTFPPHEAGRVGRLDRYKQGESANYLFLGSFRAGAAGNPLPMVKRAGACTYGVGHGAGGLTGLPSIQSAAYAAASNLANFIPPHASAVDVLVNGAPGGAAIGSVQVQPVYNPGAGSYYLGVGATGAPDVGASWRIPLLLQSETVPARQNLQAKSTGGGGTLPTCTITVAGWPE